MQAYRLELELRSALGTPLASDTLWGHVAWGIRWREGEGVLQDWLACHENDPEPPLVLSDPLPSGYLPRPALPPPSPGEAAPGPAEAAAEKSAQKRRWVSRADWDELSQALNPDALGERLQTAEDPDTGSPSVTLHAGVNRLSGGTAQPEAGTLYSTLDRHFRRGQCFEVWALSPEPLETVRQWVEWGIEGGYGRDASTGLGHLEVRSVEATTLPGPERANAALVLGTLVPRPGDPAHGFFRPGVRCGRVGGDFAVGSLPGGSGGREKKPIHCLLAGSLLLSDAPPSYAGRVLRGVHPEVEAIRHCGLTPLMPCRVEERVREEAA